MAMTPQGLSFDVLMAYTAGETRYWYDLFAEHPEALDVEVGEGRMALIRGLVLHIFAVELRYAERLLGEDATSYETLPVESLDDLFSIFGRGRDKLGRFVERATDDELRTALTFETVTAGTVRATKRTLVGHALLHGIRHWAQIAMALRRAGLGTQWPHDLIFSDAIR
ncbi:MAG: DinB family protein [Gemmatimonadaceae bacterium]